MDLKGKKPKKITVIGHTDSIGNPKYNQELSLKRAISLAKHLRNFKIFSKTTFRTIGIGSSASIAENNTAIGRQKNRRVEFIVEF